jgi:hypothetical protein
MQPPAFDYALPTFRVLTTRHSDGRPDTVTITPTARGGTMISEAQVFTQIGDALRSAIYQELRPYRQLWTRNNLRRNVTGILQMNNRDDSRHAHTEDLEVSNINFSSIQEIFYKATGTGSNPDLTIYNVEFVFWINPLSFDSGRGKSWSLSTQGTISNLLLGIIHQTLQVPKPKDPRCTRTVNCAASAIAFILARHGYYGPTHQAKIGQKREIKNWYWNSIDLMDKFKWKEDVLISQIPEFVKHFPEYRIVIVNTITKSSSTRDFKGENYIQNEEDKIIYLHHDVKNQHFIAINKIKAFARRKGPGYNWCINCSFITTPASTCQCGNITRAPTVYKDCLHCGKSYSPTNKHTCYSKQCRGCHIPFNTEDDSMLYHRCPIFMSDSRVHKPFIGEDDSDSHSEAKNQYNLWVYDIESALIPTDMRIPSYDTDEDGYFPTEHQITFVTQSLQVPNLVVWKNVFTKECHNSYSIDDFIEFMLTVNDGYNMVIAHNSKGYDGRLVFESITKFQSTIKIEPLLRGTQMIRLKVGNTLFQDSLLHLSGSLASLAKDFLQNSGIPLEKGEFPHFFNREEYRNYVGPLPGDEFYDLKFTLKDDESKRKHENFRREWEGRTDWDAEKYLLEYCKNDVDILCEIVYLHHLQCIQIIQDYNTTLAVSPWHFTTAAGYMHKLFLMEQSLLLPKSEKDPKIIQQVTQSSWAALEVNEHYFSKLALRGGRTEVRKFYHKTQPNEVIKCIDVHSMYPSIQIGKDITVAGQKIPLLFPVGTPIIEVHDIDYYPCNFHFMNPDQKCKCAIDKKVLAQGKKLEIKICQETDLHEYINNFDGIIMVDATPSNIYHPILPVYDEETKKCVFSCKPIIGKTFASPILKVALSQGYVVTKIYRADRYKMRESKWKGLLGSMYKMKYYSSSNGDKTLPNETVEENHQRHYHFYKNNFDIELDFSQCKKRPALKLSSKVLINSPWGKHAESVDHTQTKVLDYEDTVNSEEFLYQIEKRQVKVKEITNISQDRTLFKYDELRQWNDKIVRPNLHKGYLPCAVFVPMYGQLMTWNILNQVGERALMCDTDSVKYISNGIDPDIQASDCLGEWEDEGNLLEFVSIGLKSYGLRYANGKPDSFKLKGCCLKRSHKNLINFDSMKEMLFDARKITIPQLSFDYKIGEGIKTRQYLKMVKFDQSILKGDYDEDNYTLYPFNYTK